MSLPELPRPDAIDQVRARIAAHIVETPVIDWPAADVAAATGVALDLSVKLELFQRAGSFKARGALNNILTLSADQRARGVTAVSAGNHAIATAFAARAADSHAKVVMAANASPFRIAQCRAVGADVVLADDIAAAFAEVRRIADAEGRALIHPFRGMTTHMGPATLAREWLGQAPDLDALVVPVGGGGLICGIALAVKSLKPSCRIFGVEPTGAASMGAAFHAGRPVDTAPHATIADSLAPPPPADADSLAICQAYVDDFVTVSDADTRAAMRVMLAHLKLAVEPAPATGLAAMIGPLAARLAGRKTGLLICGANIDAAHFQALISTHE